MNTIPIIILMPKYVVQLDMNDPWRIIGVYGYARAEDKALTWDLMLALGQQSSLPGLMVGDFNEIICNEEKFGGPRLQIGHMLRFREALRDCSFEDLGRTGSLFIRLNKFTKERLDRDL